MVEKVKNASSLALLILATLQVGRAVAVKVVEEALDGRGQASTEWSMCAKCGKKNESKGLASREMLTLIGVVKWWKRRGCCPDGCKTLQVVPSDEALGLKPYQQTSLEVKCMACA